jgi:hypothetical protein
MNPNNNLTAYEKVCTLIMYMDREVLPNVFMASYGEDEVRFYTNELHEPQLLHVIKWKGASNQLEQTLQIIRKVTKTI